MGLFDFFLKNKEVESRTTRKLSLGEISYKVEGLFKESDSKVKIIKEEINKNIALMDDDLKAQINVLKSINLEQRKEDERLKKIVMENLGFYISHLDNLIDEFEKTKSLEVKEGILKIQFILDDFSKKSHKSYEKATILIGEEVEQTKEIIKNFNKGFVKIAGENESVFIKIGHIQEFKELNSKIEDLRGIKEGINRQIKSLRELKIKQEKQKSFFEEDYSKFKQSEEFKELFMQEQRLNGELSKLNNEIMGIKEKINIRFLLKYYHGDNKCSELLKNYRENFIEALGNDETLEIARLVEKVLAINIQKELLDLRERDMNLRIRDNLPAQAKLNIFEDRIKNADLEISGLKEKESAEIKKLERANKKEAFFINGKINKAKEIIGDIEIVNANKLKEV